MNMNIQKRRKLSRKQYVTLEMRANSVNYRNIRYNYNNLISEEQRAAAERLGFRPLPISAQAQSSEEEKSFSTRVSPPLQSLPRHREEEEEEEEEEQEETLSIRLPSSAVTPTTDTLHEHPWRCSSSTASVA